MSETKHTPGPWTVIGETGVLSGDGLHYVAHADVSSTLPVEEIKPNVRLIAAAPEMLEALKAVMRAEIIYTGAIEESFEDHAPDDLVAQVSTAIAKAEGRK